MRQKDRIQATRDLLDKEYIRCKAMTNFGRRCVKDVSLKGLCTQHLKVKRKK